MGGPGGPSVSHLKLWALEKAAFETLDSQPDRAPQRRPADPSPRASPKSERKDSMEQQQLLQQLLQLKQKREEEEKVEEPAQERVLLSPPHATPKSSPLSPRRLSRDSSTSRSPAFAAGTRPSAKPGKNRPVTPMNSPAAFSGAGDEGVPHVFVSMPRGATPAAGTPPLQEELTSLLPTLTLAGDRGLASALNSVPSRGRLGIAEAEEIDELVLEPAPPALTESSPQAQQAEAMADEGTPMSDILGSLSSAADQECWKLLQDQLAVMHRDVQDYAHRTFPAKRFQRVNGAGPPRRLDAALPEAPAPAVRPQAPYGSGHSGSASFEPPRARPISRCQSQPESWAPPAPPTPQTPQFDPRSPLRRMSPQQELQRQDGSTGSNEATQEQPAPPWVPGLRPQMQLQPPQLQPPQLQPPQLQWHSQDRFIPVGPPAPAGLRGRPPGVVGPGASKAGMGG
ncbi:unnamed protein product [Effrenium voratum]|uniref:Uncharacterized protein n=1 Tax=Effrenium voratum TaxID=2562239 RepID=A0AA36JME6_9DINO|nr:unnamed protein product [Effrenium voratum]